VIASILAVAVVASLRQPEPERERDGASR